MYKFIVMYSLFLVAADAQPSHPAVGVSGGKEQRQMKALFCTWPDICLSESPCCAYDATAGAVRLNVNFVHRLESKLVLDPSEIEMVRPCFSNLRLDCVFALKGS